MSNLIGDEIGFIHVIASCFAIISGTLVLALKKGTKFHIRAGYFYVVSMVLLLVTALMIYRLFNGWGIFHYMTILSITTLVMGMLPIWFKKPINKWKHLHFTFMYWSVIGLYAAFAAEVLTRIPDTPFFGMVGVATFGIMLSGGVFFGINKMKWIKTFDIDKKK